MYIFVCLSVCLSVRLSTRCLKNRWRWDYQTWHRNVPPWVPETYLFWGQQVKVEGRGAKKQCRCGFCTLV